MYRYFYLLIAGWIMLAVFSCSSQAPDGPGPEIPTDPDLGGVTETGNPLQGGEVVFLAYSASEFDTSSNLRAVTRTSNATVSQVNEAFVVVVEMTFENDEGCPDLIFPMQGMVIDLLKMMDDQGGEAGEGGERPEEFKDCHPTMNTTFGPFTGSVSGADSVLGQRLIGLSILIRVEGVGDQPIEFRGRQEWSQRFREPEEWIDPKSGENIIVGFDRDSWFEGIDVNDGSYPVVLEGDESLVVVDSDQYPQVLDLLINNTLDSMNIFVDENGNRELDATEFLKPITFVE